MSDGIGSVLMSIALLLFAVGDWYSIEWLIVVAAFLSTFALAVTLAATQNDD